MISKRYNAQMGNYLAKLAKEQNNLGTWQESIIKEYKPKQTNADRIRSMTDKELAEFISGKARTFGEEYEGYMSALYWLKEEANDD